VQNFIKLSAAVHELYRVNKRKINFATMLKKILPSLLRAVMKVAKWVKKKLSGTLLWDSVKLCQLKGVTFFIQRLHAFFYFKYKKRVLTLF